MAKKKYYMVLDTETATLPFADTICKTASEKKKIAIAKPLVYDIGWVISDRQGNIVKSRNFLVQETFFVPNVFNTAYYKAKRPIYMKLYKEGAIQAANWEQIIMELQEDLRAVDITAAYNAAFDFKKAIPFTERYISHLYDEDYNAWELGQKKACRDILSNNASGENPDFLKPFFELREERFPIVDLWALACDRLININKYRNYCLQHSLLTASAQYFKTSAETSFQYLMSQYDFVEDHTALSDAKIEAQILAKALKRGKVEPGMKPFPFKELGTTFSYVQTKQPKYIGIVLEALEKYIADNNGFGKESSYWKKIIKAYKTLSGVE